MLRYTRSPLNTYHIQGIEVSSFIEKEKEKNIDWGTVKSFGSEWQKFHSFREADLSTIGRDYFDLIHADSLRAAQVLDVGCGSGRWARYLSSRVRFIEAIDPSDALFSAALNLRDLKNIRATQASVWDMPFEDHSFDLVYCLGVLHHLPDASTAIEKCVKKIKPGGLFLLYLYYDLEGRGVLFRVLFHMSTVMRWFISKLPFRLKSLLCDLIALMIYLPLAGISNALDRIHFPWVENIPLSYYRKTSFHIMRNDALDRFGTPLEKRFSKKEIITMLSHSGLDQVTFSENPPYWHVVAKKPY